MGLHAKDLPRVIEVKGQSLDLLPLALKDLDALLAIEQRSHATPWTAANFTSSLASHWCVGVHDSGGQLLAYAVLSFAVGEGELLLFVVDKPWQGRGLGRRFLDELIFLCRLRANSLFLEVRASNLPAINLYEGRGFNQVGVRPNYYPAGKGRREDAWLFALELAENGFFGPLP